MAGLDRLVAPAAEMVSDRRNGFLVDVGDVDRLAEALFPMPQDPSLRSCMGRSGREVAVADYHADVVARRT